jgi:hypothetical protein
MTTTKTIFSCMRQPQALRHCFFQQVAGQQILRVSRCVPFLVAAIAAASSSETGDDTSISEPIQIRHLTCLPPFSTVIVAGGEPDCNPQSWGRLAGCKNPTFGRAGRSRHAREAGAHNGRYFWPWFDASEGQGPMTRCHTAPRFVV